MIVKIKNKNNEILTSINKNFVNWFRKFSIVYNRRKHVAKFMLKSRVINTEYFNAQHFQIWSKLIKRFYMFVLAFLKMCENVKKFEALLEISTFSTLDHGSKI